MKYRLLRGPGDWLRAIGFLGNRIAARDLKEIERLEVFRRIGFPGNGRAFFNTWKAHVLSAGSHPQYTLSRILRHAVDTVSRYEGLDPDRLEVFPLVGKEEMRENLDAFISSHYTKDRMCYFTTAGSTGEPFGFFYSPEVDIIRDAFFAVMWGRAGYSAYQRSVVLRGHPVEKSRSGARVSHSFDPLNNELRIATYHLSWDTIGEACALICRFRPAALMCYPSMGTLLARYLLSRKTELRVEKIFCGSENLYPWQMELMERAFHGRVLSWYGHSENAVLGVLRADRLGYDIFHGYGHVEIVDGEGRTIDRPGEVGEIVATSLINYGMPFIRYRTGDRAMWLDRPPAHSDGHGMPVISLIEGRLQELFVGSGGELMSMTAVNMHSDVFDGLKQFQFVQDHPGRMLMKLVPAKSTADVDLDMIRQALVAKTLASVDYEFRFVDEIPLPPNGKHRFLIQNLDLQRFGVS